MAGFHEIIGHDDVVNHLQNAIQMGKVSHAYIFNGEVGAGKKMLASAFAMALQCEKHGTDPCMECDSCKRALSKNHPDIITITHEKPNSIGIEDIRIQLIDDVSIKPYTGPYKIYILNEAEKLTLQAQNALLKTIEEPPAYAVILLLTSNADSLLPTISSRCVTLNLRPVKESDVKEYLMEHMHLPDYQAQIDAAFAQGNIGKAKQIAESTEFAEMAERAFRLLRKSNELELYELVEMIKELTAEKQNIYDYLDLFTMWFRDVLLFKATKEVDGLIFKDQYNYIKERAKKSSYEGIENIIDAIGGVTVDSDYEFWALNEFYIQQGENDLNGEEALAFARERYALPGGDNDRGKNQMKVITGVVKKLTSGTTILSNYTQIMDSLEGMFATNFNMNDLSKLVKMQLDDMASWHIVSYAVTGYGDSRETCSAPGEYLYVTIPDQDSVDRAIELIDMVMDGKTLPDEP